jgi:uncharacterized protein
MTTRQRLEEDLKGAMRAGDATTRDAIRYLLSAVKNAEIDARGTGVAADADAALRKVGKQLADAIDQYRAAGRDDLAAHENAQLEVLKRYLPQEMSDQELQAAVSTAITESGASGAKDMGRVMPLVLAKTAGRADGRRVSGAVKDALSRL